VKAKLHTHLSKMLHGTEQEEKVNDEGSALEDSPLLSKQQMTLREKSRRYETAEQGKVDIYRGTLLQQLCLQRNAPLSPRSFSI